MYFSECRDGYHFSSNNIRKIEEHYRGEYVGYFCTKRFNGSWNEIPVDVFYQPSPDVSKGHTHYFGMYRDSNGHVMITDASSAFEHPMVGVVANDGEIVFSRYRHDFRKSKDGTVFIDGGRDYIRYGYANSNSDVDNVLPRLVRVRVMGAQLAVVE